jgi:ABC-type thiamin/hydroxymethylpyrimidine transport system permease subunit
MNIDLHNTSDNLNTQDLIFLVVLSVFIGTMWMLYGIFFHLVHPALAALNLTGIIRGIWNISGGIFGIILRKKYSAFLGNILPSVVEMSFSTWGFYNILYGLFEGATSELFFRVYGYKRSTISTMLFANVAVAITSFFIDCLIFNLYKLSLGANIFRLSTDIVSTIAFSIPTIFVIRYLLKLGYLKPYAISNQ